MSLVRINDNGEREHLTQDGWIVVRRNEYAASGRDLPSSDAGTRLGFITQEVSHEVGSSCEHFDSLRGREGEDQTRSYDPLPAHSNSELGAAVASPGGHRPRLLSARGQERLSANSELPGEGRGGGGVLLDASSQTGAAAFGHRSSFNSELGAGFDAFSAQGRAGLASSLSTPSDGQSVSPQAARRPLSRDPRAHGLQNVTRDIADVSPVCVLHSSSVPVVVATEQHHTGDWTCPISRWIAA